MAFLIVLSVIGVIALAVYIYLLQRTLDGRLDALNSFLDSVDERLSERSNDLVRRIEEVKTHQSTLEEKVSQERVDREASGEELFRKHDQLLDRLNELTEKLEASLSESRSVTEEKLAAVTTRLDEQRTDIEAYARQVKEVRGSNLIHLALEYLSDHQAEEAAKLMREVLREQPDNLEARVVCIRAESSWNALHEARELVDAGLSIHPDNPDLLTESAKIYRLEKNRTERARVISEGLEKFPEHPGLLFERSLLSVDSHRYSQARDDLSKLLQLGHESAEIHYNLGVVYVAQGDIPRGVSELRKSLVFDPTSPDTNHSLGLALMHGERYREAVDFLERARELLPSTISVRLDLAAALRQSGQAEEALRECAVARHLNPAVQRTGIEEALAYLALGQFNEALSCLEGVLQTSPKLNRARRLKAETLAEIGRHLEAAEEWGRMVQDSPEDPYLHARLGEALKKAGQDSAALGSLEIAARMAPNSMPIQLSFAREALAQRKFELVQEVVEQAYPRASTAESLLQLIEIRLILALIANRWIAVVTLLSELGRVLTEHPEVIPFPEDARIDGQSILALGLSKEAARVHSALMDLFDGAIQVSDFEELVNRVMRSMLPPKPPPKPLEAPAAEQLELTEVPGPPPGEVQGEEPETMAPPEGEEHPFAKCSDTGQPELGEELVASVSEASPPELESESQEALPTSPQEGSMLITSESLPPSAQQSEPETSSPKKRDRRASRKHKRRG